MLGLLLRVAALVSGGKDSALALHRALRESHEVDFLVAMIPQREDSWMFHYPNIHLVDMFAEASGIPLVKGHTVGIKEEEVEDLQLVLAKLDVEGVVSGAIASQYQKHRISKVCRDLGLQSITPLWKEDPLRLLQELIDQQIKAMITGVYAHGFNESWLGRYITPNTISALLQLNHKYQISIVGEGGEYETLVLDAPFFKKKIAIIETKKIWENQSGWLQIEKAQLYTRNKNTVAN